MKFTLAFLLFVAFTVQGQDRVFFLNGELREGKITEINPDDIVLETDHSASTINKNEILLLEYKNGLIERINTPVKNVIFRQTSDHHQPKSAISSDEKLNQLSVNTLAFVNADISLFYERITNDKKFGFGIMGAYNFNKYALAFNTFFALLSNAKKKMDAGIFVNYYPGQFAHKKNLFVGILIKYTSFDYSATYEETVWNGTQSTINVSYSPASGSQVATMVTIGSHYIIGKNLFIKTMYGLGGFFLKGQYYEQFNYMFNRGAPPSQHLDIHFLPKLYFGLNAGYNF